MDGDAIPPSSPPLVHTTNLAELPLFERDMSPLSPKSSSPPPMFSSDDSGESVDVTNYQSPRIFKNKRKGTWWANGEAAHNHPEPKKSKMTRNFDSGVYMMSDASESSDSVCLHKPPFGSDGVDDLEPELQRPTQMKPEPRRPTQAESDFCDKLRAGMEMNQDRYSWDDLDLEDEDIKQIGHLASVVKTLPDTGTDIPAEGQYRSMEPELIVNLSQNKLCRLTPSLFGIQFLTSLVLRHNHIKELPQQIGKLCNLRTLDVSFNQITYLPFEVLSLLEPFGHLNRLVTFNNPLMKPIYIPHESIARVFAMSALAKKVGEDQAWITRELDDMYNVLPSCDNRNYRVAMIRLYESLGKFADNAIPECPRFFSHHPAAKVMPKICSTVVTAPRYIARSLVSYLDEQGNVIRNSASHLSPAEEPPPFIIDTARGAYGVPSSVWYSPPSVSHVASLLTTSLHNVLRKRKLDDLTIQGVRDRLAEHVPRAADAIFSRAIDNSVGGYSEFRQCHVCNRDYIVARAEWVEYWTGVQYILSPFKISVCSRGCVPEEMRVKPEKELTW